MLLITAPVSIPVPVIAIPLRNLVVSETVTVLSEAVIELASVKVSSVITVFVACPLPAYGDS